MPVDGVKDTKSWGIVNGFGISPTYVNSKMALNIALDLSRLAAQNAVESESANRTVSQNMLFTSLSDSLKSGGITVEQLKYVFANPKTKYVSEKIMGPNNVQYEKVITEETEKYFVKEQDLKTTIDNIKKRGDKVSLNK